MHASLFNPDGAAIAESQVQGLKLLASFGDLQRTPFSGFAASARFVSANPETVKKFSLPPRGHRADADQPHVAARVAEQTLGMEGKAALAAVRTIVTAISVKNPGVFSETGMGAWIADNAANAGRKIEDVKISEVADLRLLREVQQELGIRCEGGYGCEK